MFVLGPLSLSKTKWSAAIWDMNVEGSQWGSLGANAMEQALALVRRIPEQLPNLIASVRDPPDRPRASGSALRLPQLSLRRSLKVLLPVEDLAR